MIKLFSAFLKYEKWKFVTHNLMETESLLVFGKALNLVLKV